MIFLQSFGVILAKFIFLGEKVSTYVVITHAQAQGILQTHRWT